jgi:diaminopimelate decarboxylase
MAGSPSKTSSRSKTSGGGSLRKRTTPAEGRHFAFRRAELNCECVPLTRIAERWGTPAYVYSAASISAAYEEYVRAFRSIATTICYSVKANSNLKILKLLARLGSGFDIVSGGELYRLRRAGIAGRRIVFSGVGKTREEIREALREKIFLFNVESTGELEVLISEASRAGRCAPGAIRINPDVQAGGHAHISTGKHQHKFGMDWKDARRAYLTHRDSRWIEWKGISAHIGSQIFNREAIRSAATKIAGFVKELARAGVELKHADIGGGLGVRYANESPISIPEYAGILTKIFKPLGCELLLEPGRSIVGPTGVLLTRVLYTKINRGKNFIVVDAAMNDFIRPALYGGVHPISPVKPGGRASAEKMIRADIVGPVCESGDCLLHDWPIEPVQAGDLLVLWGAGAYGFSQASNYNSRPRPVEILVDGKKARVIRKRETRSDLIRGEEI